jgi:Ca2+-transporting ATPase
MAQEDLREQNTGSDGRVPVVETAHSLPVDDVVERLRSSRESGLSSETARERLREKGANELARSEGMPAWRIFIGQFSSIVVWLLMAAAAVALFTDNLLESVAILVVLLLNAFFGFLIEWQAGRALDALRKATRSTSRVRRDGRESLIDSTEIVIGDLIVLSAGDRVPADARLIEAVRVRTDESTLTGESVAVEKSAEPTRDDVSLAERHSMIYLGSTVVSGRALAVVTATGNGTELGKVGQLLQETADTKTPLERRLAHLGKILVYIVLAIAVVVMAAGLLRGSNWWLMAEVSISLAVAAVPEGLPAVTTLILALGVLRMARRSAIVRHLAAVETLGSTTVICTDKTGTLTENRMTVVEIYLADDRYLDLGNGSPDHSAADDQLLLRLLRVAVLCNEAVYESKEKQFIGDPTETALLAAADEFGVEIACEQAKHRKVSEIPFDTSTKRMVTVFDDGRHFISMVKGAPAVVIDASKYAAHGEELVTLNDDERKRLLETNEQMASRSLRVLAFAEKVLQGEHDDEPDLGYTFLGLIGMLDPPRPEAAAAVRDAHEAGIRVVMLTGDQVPTAQAIARDLGLGSGDVFALHSRDLAEADPSKLAELARKALVFARVSPEDKLNIVKALQETGEIVAVTGDGVNDAPALKQADIGIAFGGRGTDVAKEAADIVLTNDNFSTIVAAIEGGRTIYANIVKFVHLMFSQNLGEIIVILGAIILNLPLPLLPLQILWINLVTDIFPALALALEPSGVATMSRPPRSPKETFLSGPFLLLISWQGVMLGTLSLGAYYWALGNYGEGSHARTVAMLSLIGVQLGHLFNCRSRTKSVFQRPFSNPFLFLAVGLVVGLQILAIYVSPLASILDLVRPSSIDLKIVTAVSLAPILIVETTKLIARYLAANHRSVQEHSA